MNKKQLTGEYICNKEKLLHITKDIDPSWGLGYATVEHPDTEGDVVEVKGIDFNDYHNPTAGKHLTMLANHSLSLDSGLPPVVGRVEQMYNTEYAMDDGSTVPALAFSFSWAPGEVSQAWQSLYPKYVKSFSVGIMYNGKDVMPNPTGGQQIQKCKLYEISPVAVPANSSANAIKVIKSALHIVDNEELQDTLKQFGLQLTELKAYFDNTLNKSQKDIEKLLNINSEMSERYDLLESIIATSSNTKPSTVKSSQKKMDSQEQDTIRELTAKFDELIKFASKK